MHSKNKQLKTKNPVDTILNGKTNLPVHKDYKRALAIKTPKEETVHVKNPITGKEADIVLSRQGTTDEKLAMIMLAPDASKEQRDSMLASYLFERGRENASFITELFVSKGTHVKETQAFKRQIRFDFESFANIIALLFQDLANDLRDSDTLSAINNFADRLEKGSEMLVKQREHITNDRMREKGYGVYLDRNGKAFSIFDDEIEGAIKSDKEKLHEEQTSKKKDGK